LGQLFAPKRDNEQVQAAIVRYRVGRKVQFCLLNGLRHSEMNLIPKTGISWEARQVRIKQGKTGNYKVIGPLGPTSMAILREFFDASKTDWCVHAAATSRRSFIGFSEKPAGVPAYRTEGRILTAWFSTTPGIQRLRTFWKAT
jgi:hypothetical protein